MKQDADAGCWLTWDDRGVGKKGNRRGNWPCQRGDWGKN